MSEVKAQNSISMTSVKAIKDASDEATTLLDGMRQSALDAGTTLNGIYQVAKDAEQSASDAQASADSASEYASRAYANLSSVQSITETLNWITAHGTMTLTSDTALDPSHVYFVVDANGDYVVGGTHYSVVSEPVLDDIGSYYELSINESLNNYVATHLVVDTEGLWIIPDAGGNKVLIATGSGSTYTTAGTYIVSGSTVLASFTATGIQVGQTGESHLEMDYHSMQLVDKEGDTYFYVSDLRDKDDGYQATLTETFRGDGTTKAFRVGCSVSSEVSAADSSDASNTATRNDSTYTFVSAPSDGATVTIVYKTLDAVKAYTFGKRRSDGNVGANSVAEGSLTIASGYGSHAEGFGARAEAFFSHAEGQGTKATGWYSHSEGQGSEASGENSHAEGADTTASGERSHAEGGLYTTASGRSSHAEGSQATASGDSAHAEGYLTTASSSCSHAEGSQATASGPVSHAEGMVTVASGQASHAQNRGTKASSHNQTALGSYNIEDTNGDYAVIIGNGTSNTARSNAFAITWDGDAHMALDTTATSGTDKEIYDALVSLGWDSDCIV